MTTAIDTLIPSSSDVAPLRAKSGWIVALGVAFVIAGLVALGSVVMATVASVFIVGVMMMIAGVAEVINAFQFKTWGRFLLWVLLGVLYIVAGFVTLENPLLAAAMLTLVLGVILVASGIMRIVLALGMRKEKPWIWIALSGVDHTAAGTADSVALAGVGTLYLGNFPRHRSAVRRRWLDCGRHGAAPRD